MFTVSFFLVLVAVPPSAKRPKTLERSNPSPPSCSGAPSEVAKKKLENADKKPVYCHWMALLLQSKFEDADLTTNFTLDDVGIAVPTTALNTILEQFKRMANRVFDNEYEFTSQITRHLDRFYFDDRHVHEGAVLAQYPLDPLDGTKRGDACVVLYDGSTWAVKHPVLATNDSKMDDSDFEKARRESRLYSICALSKCEHKFPYFFSFPICSSVIELEMHRIVNKRLEYIELFKASFTDAEKLRRFFILTYGIVRWATVKDSQRWASLPSGVMPSKNLELFDKFNDRVYLKEGIVYKFFTDHRLPHSDLMTEQGIQEVKLESLTSECQLLSYKYIEGQITPAHLDQFLIVGETLKCIHGRGLIHGDVREGNIIFTPNGKGAYLIDFDYTSPEGSRYPDNYNQLPERHAMARPNYEMKYEHDWYSLIYLMFVYFNDFTGIDGDLKEHLEKHGRACKEALSKKNLI